MQKATLSSNDAQDMHAYVGAIKTKEFLSPTQEQKLIPLAREAVIAAERLETDKYLERENKTLPKEKQYKTLSKKEKCKLEKRVAAGKSNLDELIVRNLRLVAHIAKRFVGRCQHVEMLDLIAEGVLGFIHAIGKFEVDHGERLSMYAMFWIKQVMQRAVAYQGRTVRLPVHIHNLLAKYQAVYQKLQNDLGHEPHLEEIAFWMNIPMKDAAQLEKMCQNSVSLEVLSNNEEHNPLTNFLDDKRQLPADKISEQESLPTQVEEMLVGLRPREREILILRLGLKYGHEPQSLATIGKCYKITKERVRQIQAQATRKLRQRQDVKVRAQTG